LNHLQQFPEFEDRRVTLAARFTLLGRGSSSTTGLTGAAMATPAIMERRVAGRIAENIWARGVRNCKRGLRKSIKGVFL